jgi:hypothetical protein
MAAASAARLMGYMDDRWLALCMVSIHLQYISSTYIPNAFTSVGLIA